MLRVKIRAHDVHNAILAKLSSEALADVAGDALKAGLERLADEVKARAPVETGRLRDSIKVEYDRAHDGKVSGRVVVGEHYAMFLEFGTVHMAARPFMAPAVEAAKDRVRDDAARIIRDGISRGL